MEFLCEIDSLEIMDFCIYTLKKTKGIELMNNNPTPKMCERCGEALQRKKSGPDFNYECQYCGAEEESHD